jgi:hypothetical protein
MSYCTVLVDNEGICFRVGFPPGPWVSHYKSGCFGIVIVYCSVVMLMGWTC